MLYCKGMCSFNIPFQRNGAFVVDSFMERLRLEGEWLDRHTFSEHELDDECVTFRTHEFDYRRGFQIALSSVMVRSALPWCATVKYYQTHRIPKRSRKLLEEIVSTEGFNILFTANGPDLKIGPFFSRCPVLRDPLDDFLREIEGKDIHFSQVGTTLWDIISHNGGLTILRETREDLWESVIAYKMKLKDPYCLDWSRK